MDGAELNEKIETLKLSIQSFNHLWGKDVINAFAWRVPTSHPDNPLDIIKPEELDKKSAVLAANKILTQFKRDGIQHPSSVVRLPGVVEVDHDIIGLVQNINTQKDEIKALLIDNIDSERTRNAFVKRELPGYSMLQLYRHIPVVSASPRKILFTWVGRTTSIYKTTPEKIIKSLLRAKKVVPEGVQEEKWHATIDIDIASIRTLHDSSELVYQRPVAPFPRVLVYHDQPIVDDREVASLTANANLPLFIPKTEGYRLIPLKTWDRKAVMSKKKRSDARETQLLISRLNLYLRV